MNKDIPPEAVKFLAHAFPASGYVKTKPAHSGMERAGFTLIEFSIVLVIIGLIVGGILVGQDLVKGAEVRAQISQIEKYNSAVNTFRAKFGALPGDMPPSLVSQFGFALGSSCNGSTGGKRNGNGLIEGDVASGIPISQGENETILFWEDIGNPVAGNLIDLTVPNSGGGYQGCFNSLQLSTTPGITYLGDYFPQGKIGYGTFLYVYQASGYNWFALSTVTSVASFARLFSSASIPVIQAYCMDAKMDDGFATSGFVQAVYINGSGSTLSYPASAAADSAITCYNTASSTYSISSLANYGSKGNCALSFRFQ